jgi:hypothetical protein
MKNAQIHPLKNAKSQIRKGCIQIDRQASGAYVFQDEPEVLEAVRNLRNHAVRNIDLRINQLHREGH